MDQDTAASGPTDSPADAASDSLSQARKEHAAGRYDAARADLKSAAQFFDKVALSAGKFAEDASHTLTQESRDIERKIGAAADMADIDKKQSPTDPAATGARYQALETEIENLVISL